MNGAQLGGFLRRHLIDLAIVGLAVAVVIGSIALIRRDADERDSAAADASQAAAAEPAEATQLPADDDVPAVLWVGDGYVSGAGVGAVNSYPNLVCRRLGWNCNFDAQDTTGFLNPGNPGAVGGAETATIPARLAETARTYTADIVIIDGGREDTDYPTSDRITAVDDYLRAVRAAWPQATLVMVIPSSLSDPQPASYYEYVGPIEAGAADVDARVVDPVALGWYDVAQLPDMTTTDGRSPNGLGNAYLAERFENEMVTLGLAQPNDAALAPTDPDSGTRIQFDDPATESPAPIATEGTP